MKTIVKYRYTEGQRQHVRAASFTDAGDAQRFAQAITELPHGQLVEVIISAAKEERSNG